MKAKKDKKLKNPEGVNVTKEFTFKLTGEEIAKKDLGARALTIDINDLTAKFKEVKADWNAKIRTRVASRDELAVVAESGEEKRVVEAIMVKDYASREITYYFEGKKVESRTMTKEECQMEMDELNPKSTRGKKQKIKDSTANLSGMTPKTSDDEIKDAIKEETNKKTKRSAVDGPTIN